MRTTHRQFRAVLGLLAFVLTFPLIGAARADRVELTSDTNSSARLHLEGEIIDYTGRTIRVRLRSGLEKSYAGDRVIAIDSDWLASHQEADAAWNEGDVAAALALYTKALSADERVWVRRLLLSRIVYCLWSRDQVEQAAQRFLALVASDPDTPYFAAIPLAWEASEGVSKSTAIDWLGREQNQVARLLGASYLLATDHRSAAIAALKTLRTSDDARVAALAEAQLWRVDSFRATRAEADRWQTRVEQMPNLVRAGPYFLLGQTLLRQKRFEEAALALMHLPILYPDARPLAAASLLRAGDALVGLGQTSPAVDLFREAERTFPHTRWQTQATQRLQTIQAPEAQQGSR